MTAKGFRIAIAVVSIWAVLYVGFWMQRSGCGHTFTMTCNDASLRAIGDFIMLGWVSKYQVLVAGLFTLAAAIIAVTPVYRQLDEQRRQSAATAIPIVTRVAQEHEEHAARFKKLSRQVALLPSLLETYDDGNVHDLHREWLPEMYGYIAVLTEMEALLDARLVRQQDDSHLIIEGDQHLDYLRQETSRFAYAFRVNTGGADYSIGEEELPQSEERLRRRRCEGAYSAWSEWSERYEIANNDKAFDAWHEVRSLERAAVAQ